jgi:hypothetical protein
MEIKIREITTSELPVLEDLLYEAVYQADETNPIPREVVNIPQVRVYIDKFGQKKDDCCLVADLDGEIVGWRMGQDFGRQNERLWKH